jgi:hypothetical protein
MSVCAVLGESTARLEQALAAQSASVDAVVVAEGLRSGAARALETGADWIWVLDGSTLPRPDALRRLFDGLERVRELPAPALMEGVVVTAEGQMYEPRATWYRRFDLDVAMASVDRRLLPVRGSSGPVLVQRDAAEAERPRDGAPIAPGSLLEWTARILRDRAGYMVAESESEIAEPGHDPIKAPATAARLMLGGGLVRLERLALVLELAVRPGAGPRLRRADQSGLR